MNDYLVQLGKTISHALRHKPELYGLALDSEGWVAISGLLDALRSKSQSWQDVSEKDLEDILAQSEKQRFELQDGKIRAFYGHSIPAKLEKVPITPPAVLYHGTTP